MSSSARCTNRPTAGCRAARCCSRCTFTWPIIAARRRFICAITASGRPATASERTIYDRRTSPRAFQRAVHSREQVLPVKIALRNHPAGDPALRSDARPPCVPAPLGKRSRASLALASGVARPAGKGEIHGRVETPLDPYRRDAFALVGVCQNRIASPEPLLRQIAIHADHTRAECNHNARERCYLFARGDSADSFAPGFVRVVYHQCFSCGPFTVHAALERTSTRVVVGERRRGHLARLIRGRCRGLRVLLPDAGTRDQHEKQETIGVETARKSFLHLDPYIDMLKPAPRAPACRCGRLRWAA